jgi:RNA polymerase sigma-70 factor (ECF subfamily)
VWLKWDRVRAVESPSRYLYRTAFNAYRNRQRAARRAARRLFGSEETVDPIAVSDSRSAVLDALRELPPRARSAVVLTDLLGFTPAEAAEVLGITASTVRSLAARAREQLRHELGDNDG